MYALASFLNWEKLQKEDHGMRLRDGNGKKIAEVIREACALLLQFASLVLQLSLHVDIIA